MPATFIPVDLPMEHNLQCPIRLDTFQQILGGFVNFLELKDKRMLLIVNEKGGAKNQTASDLVEFEVFGPAILCNFEDIE
jgi:hypothetical protein